MAKSINQKLKLINYERLKNSIYGNPKYLCFFENENGEIIKGKTATNSSVAYCITGFLNEFKVFSTHFTNSGNLIIDYVK